MTLFSILSPLDLTLAVTIAFVAGWIKGMVGFGMPMILVSGLSMILPPDLALAGLILPTLVTNGVQALREGTRAAVESIRRFRVFLIVGLIFLLAGAQLVTLVPASTFLLMIGAPVTFFALIQVLGAKLTLAHPSARVEAMASAVAGFVGGMSGVWGPPTVAYLTALNTPKQEQIRVQGVIYGLGAVALVVAHLGSGILNAKTVPFSAVLIPPAMIGMWVGMRLQDRIDQASFRKATLLVLLVAGLNLLRRGLWGVTP
ncbi:sulfite exporter TauE/SafE family protein [Rhodobacteraceae bacterium B1Z28]|uniref:Probable membrane transporter protein n=1 Tax=Ruegeria haliotis TaxID=2747601 RepID=A0ABX2PUU6_9RHOB|nr:sulfite exporter TauE/SafE family protein [Ruegeria haliotis]NVO57455.1 sulfite exporter TauE/SafE family protein [Ruegeria haliotis]